MDRFLKKSLATSLLPMTVEKAQIAEVDTLPMARARKSCHLLVSLQRSRNCIIKEKNHNRSLGPTCILAEQPSERQKWHVLLMLAHSGEPQLHFSPAEQKALRTLLLLICQSLLPDGRCLWTTAWMKPRSTSEPEPVPSMKCTPRDPLLLGPVVNRCRKKILVSHPFWSLTGT